MPGEIYRFPVVGDGPTEAGDRHVDFHLANFPRAGTDIKRPVVYHVDRPEQLRDIRQHAGDLFLQPRDLVFLLLQRLDTAVPVAFELQPHVAEQQFGHAVFEREPMRIVDQGIGADEGLQMIEVKQIGAHDPHRFDAEAVMDIADMRYLLGGIFVDVTGKQVPQMLQLALDQVFDFTAAGLVGFQHLGGDGGGQQVIVEDLGELLAPLPQGLLIVCQDFMIEIPQPQEIVKGLIYSLGGVSPLFDLILARRRAMIVGHVSHSPECNDKWLFFMFYFLWGASIAEVLAFLHQGNPRVERKPGCGMQPIGKCRG